MWSILIPAEELESLSAELWELGTVGLVEETGGIRAFFDESVLRQTICSRFQLAEDAARKEVPFDSSQLGPFACDPVPIGERFWVAPSWVSDPTPAGRFRLSIDSTNAFGSGRHETTQMCIEILEQNLTAGAVVLDIGCGSGILSKAATLLGAAVFSCDIHLDSVIAARQLIQTPVFVGSADGVRARAADVVLANISAKVLDVIASDLQRIAKPNGLVVISGFIPMNPPRRYQPWKVWRKGDWECWICRQEDIESQDSPQDARRTHSQEWW